MVVQIEYVFGTIVAGYLLYRFSRKAADRLKTKPSDPFLDEIVDLRNQIDGKIEKLTERYEQELKDKFSQDVELKNRLTNFARENGLVEALKAVWNGVRYYPGACVEYGTEEISTEANGLKITHGLIEDNGDDVVEFSYLDQPYSITSHARESFDGEKVYDVSLCENGVQVFAISCGLHFNGYDVDYVCGSVSALRKGGNWIKMILEYQGRKQLEAAKWKAEGEYPGADKIKGNFEE